MIQSLTHLKATVLTKIFASVLLLIVIGIIVANWQLQAMLASQVTTVNDLQADVSRKESNASNAHVLETYISSRQPEIKRASIVLADPNQYQQQIVYDITRYANAAGIAVAGFSFPVSTITTSTPPIGLNAANVSITLENYISYTKLLVFLKYLEQNATALQITEVNIAQNSKNSSSIQSPSIKFRVYTQ